MLKLSLELRNHRLFSEIELYTSETCNLACKYCFLSKHPKDAKRDTLKKILHWFFKNSGPFVHVHIFGTEPLLRWKLLKLVFEYSDILWKMSGKRRVTKGITTNCVALTESKARYLVDHNISVLCSIDGMKRTHDKYRVFPDGRGSWDVVSKHAAYYAKLNPLAEAAMTVTPECIRNLADNLDAIYRLGFNAVALNKIEDAGPQYSHVDLELLMKKLDDVNDLIVNSAKRKRRVYAMFLTNNLLKRARKQEARNPTHTCGAAKGSISTDIHGNLYICHRAIYDKVFQIGDVYNGINWEKVNWWRTRTNKGCDYCALPNCSPCYTCSYRRNNDPFIINTQPCRFNQIIYEKGWDLEQKMKQEHVYEWYVGGN